MRITLEDLEREKQEAERKAKGEPADGPKEEEDGKEKMPRYASDMTRKQKREAEKAKLGQMKLKGKLQYIWAYYKPVIFGIIAGIMVVVFIVQQVERSRYDTVFNLGIVDYTTTDMTGGDDPSGPVRKLLGIKDKYQEVNVDTSYSFSEKVEDTDPNVVMKFTTIVAAKELDAMLTTGTIADYYKKQDFFLDLSKLFSKEECAKYGITKGETKLDVTGSKWLADNKLVGYTPVYLVVLSTMDTKPDDEVGKAKLENVRNFIIKLQS